MSHREYIDKIISSDSVEKMQQLKDVLIDAIDYIYKTDEEEYHNIEDTLFEIVDGNIIKFPQALEIVNNMKPYGMHWDFKQTETIRQENNLDDIRPIHFFLVMNQGYNDFHDMYKENLDDYIDYADMFINDEDAIPNKVDVYFDIIPKK